MTANTLLLRLDAPMQSWGTQSRFSHRDSGSEPSKSGVIGLLCAALGKPRDEAHPANQGLPTLIDLARLKMGVRVDRTGVVRRDFQTAGGGDLRRPDGTRQAYGVIRSGNNTMGTAVSERFYLSDACFVVGLESENRALLEQIQDALHRPKMPLYLGRKSFVPSGPVTMPGGLVSLPVEKALESAPWFARTADEARRTHRAVEQGLEEGVPVLMRTVVDAPFGTTANVRCDVPLDFARRQFTIRHIEIGDLVLTTDIIQEGI